MKAVSMVLALFGLAAMAPAQLRLEGILGRQVKVGVQVGSEHRHSSPPSQRHPSRGVHSSNRDRDRIDRRHRSHGEHGHWQTVYDRVFVPGCYREEYIPARYGWIFDHCGRRVWGVVAPACTRKVWVPGHYETRARRVFVRC